MKKNFDSFYKKLKEKQKKNVEEIENQSKKKAKQAVIMLLIIGILFSIPTGFVIFPVFIILSFVVYFLTFNGKERLNFYSENIIKEIVKDFKENNLKYIPKGGISKSVYNKGNFEKYDVYKSKDLLTGTINNKQELKISEVETTVIDTDEKGDKNSGIVFLGVLGVTTLEKRTNYTLRLEKNTKYMIKNRDLHVNVESSEFEQMFDIGCEDIMLVMQIFTLDMMEEIINIYEENVLKLKDRFPEIVIKDNNIFVRIRNWGFLESKHTKDLLDYDTIKDQYELIEITIRLLEIFTNKLDEIL